MKVLANDGIDKKAADILIGENIYVETKHYNKEELALIIGEYDVLIVRSATKVYRDFIDKARNTKLKLIIRAGVGLDNIDVEYARKNGIQVTNTPNASSNSVAELVLGHMIGLARYISISNVTLRQGQWNKKLYTGIELQGKTLGIIGFGRIGKALAVKSSALGMNVVFYDKFYREDDNYEFIDFKELLKKSDFISLHVPSLDKPAIGREEFEIMKEDVFLINAARGGVVDEESLLDALKEGKVAGAGIDVFLNEPTPNEELRNHPRVSITPHIGAATKEAQMRIGEEIVGLVRELKENLNTKAI